MEAFNEVQYDLVLIAHANKEIAGMIMDNLQKLDVPKEKIMWFPVDYI